MFDYLLCYYVTIHNRDCIPISFVTLQMLETVTLTMFDYLLCYYVTIHNRDCIPISFVTLQMLEPVTS